jgi:selT/selW/selH-like putative selenoprotein
LAAKLKQALDVDAELRRGSGGIFDVIVDGTLVYSKFKTHTFPDEATLVQEIAGKR